MRKGILFFVMIVLLVWSGLPIAAQIPRTLQIGVTNGTATISSQTSPGAFFGELETTTNLTPPIVWSGTFSPLFMTGMSSDVPATNAQTFFRLAQRWPVFEFAIFYNINMEIDPGNITPFTPINGSVFCNASIWAGAGILTFNSTVSAVGQVNISSTDPFATGKTDATAPPTFNLSGQPSSGVGALNLPVFGTTNAEAMLNLPPPNYAMGTAAAYSTNGQIYLANAVDLIISNSVIGTNFGVLAPSGTNITIYFQDASNTPFLTPLTPDFYLITNGNTHVLFATNYVSPTLLGSKTNIYYADWSFVTNVAFYDFRESKTVQAVQIDLGKFNIWLTNYAATNIGLLYNRDCVFDKGHQIDSIWVYNSVPLSNTTLPAVRVVNGTQLPSSFGFTVVTPMPIYVKGDYNKQTATNLVSSGTNTANTYPAALMGDAVTVLSTNWSDAYNSSTLLNSRNASNTTVNAAMLGGIVPTVKSISGNYSGGYESFMRLLENWNGATLTYNGSIVVMFPSVYATNYWSYGSYYTTATRAWGFDLNFLQQNKLPPLTPQVVNFATP